MAEILTEWEQSMSTALPMIQKHREKETATARAPTESFLRVLVKDFLHWLIEHFPQADLTILPGSVPQTSQDWLLLAVYGETSFS